MSKTHQPTLPIPSLRSHFQPPKGEWPSMFTSQRFKGWLRVLAPLVLSLGGLATLRLLGPDALDQQELRRWIAPLGKAAPWVYVLALGLRPLLLLPGHVFAAVGGMLFGTLAGTAYALLGSFLGAAVLFFPARKLGQRPLRRLAGPRYGALVRVARKHDFQFAFLTTLNPLLPTDPMLIAAAASGARFWPSVAGMLLGTLPGTFLMVQFGSGLAQGRTWMTVVSAAGLVGSLVLGGLLGRRIYREISEAPPELPEPVAPAPEPPGRVEGPPLPVS
ncbi:Uncharacterized membrane protein YdjX, TVP38/TMEM64 family, SNARE-associated domain [Stigmatella aurantiaca]|uniref:TVP38/TMEM64 family membrane protein n=2 Tax=Stigmatella aurantiaca TaxID=41 RepID=A0A1H7JKF7_STIAU|nr:Uncharacterized membrane protein YdjX, TVP38/TMEM64 family, SNARE-associated domain [Stigmatella aurantiaca]